MKRVSAVLVLLHLAIFVSAQPGDPNGGNPPGTVPISGIEWLLISGGVFGASRIYKSLRKK